MILLTVISYNGVPGEALSASFDELGGTIGRAEGNQLVLPDPERSISRVHARVVFRGGRYAIVDNGSNPIAVNGQSLGAGREQTLQPGDEVQIGGYLLKVGESLIGSARKADPFADLFGDAAHGLAAAPAPSAPAPSPLRSWAPTPPPAPAPALSRGHIPVDWNPFAPDPVPGTVPAVRINAAVPGAAGLLPELGPGGARSESLDDLFGLGAAAQSGDPLGAKADGGFPLAANTAAHADPLQAFATQVSAPPASHADHASELHSPMVLPPAQPSPGAAAGAVFSWETGPSAPPVAPPLAPVSAPQPRVYTVVDVPPPAVPVAAAARAGGAAPAPDELLQALLQGLGMPSLPLDALTPELMQLLGQLLRDATQGTVELLAARAAFKRELRAEMTMIVGRENNPLKFSPSVEVALQHLLAKPMPGFMPPAQAMRDAYDDLRAHQLGVLAGMRAALEGVLQRFDPAALEQKLSGKSTLGSLIPGARKARLWELFQELFSQISSEAQDDFHELFSRAFLKAYAAQLDELRRGPRP